MVPEIEGIREHDTRKTSFDVVPGTMPDLQRRHSDREIVPRRMVITWSRTNGDPWSLAMVEIHGPFRLKSGELGKDSFREFRSEYDMRQDNIVIPAEIRQLVDRFTPQD
jgi:hypothetical protein